ncbi:MAG: ATPase [Clostridia bacterium]|nr:ATPase [Clostridia bacterium]
MIVPMKKVSLVIPGDKKHEALRKLRKAGFLHIEISEGSGARLEELKAEISLLESAVFTVGKDKKAKEKKLSVSEALAAAKEIAALEEEKKICHSEKVTLTAELDRLKSWGEIDPKKIKSIAENGIEVAFYEMPKSEYESLGEEVKTVRLAAGKASVRFMLIVSDSDAQAVKKLDAYRFELPQISTAQAQAKVTQLSSRIKEIDEKILSYAGCVTSMKAAVSAIEKDVEFEVYATGMANENLSADGKGDFSVAYFRGYVETDNLDKLRQTAKDNSWALLIEDPTPDDNVPTKLKNNKFVSLIYPLTDFLGTVPGYFEYDISAWFLGFILIFFGIIFGDGGYGLLITAVAAAMVVKSAVKDKKVSPTFLLVGLFGLSTMLWGTLTCTWFGLSPEQLPQWIKALSVPVISNVYADRIWHPFWTQGEVGLTTAQNLQILCFTLALVQLTVAHIKGVFRNIKSVKMLGDIGSVLQLFGIYYLVLSLVVNAEVFSFGLVIGGVPVGTVAIALIGIGFVMSFVFSNYEGSIIKSITASLKNIVSVLLGVVNVFSDIVSYIRLWAVGLAGAAISATVNELAGPLLGNFMFMVLGIFLLVFGHGLNMILNVLSVIVHGIRLNTLEFSSHLDMSWSGHKFKPFEEQTD